MTDLETRLAALADREEILDLARRERFARDQMHYGVMRDCFDDDAHIRTSWYDGGADAYVEATRQRMIRYNNSKHWVFPAFARVAGDRATVESPATIFTRTTLDGVEIDITAYCRFFSRVTRRSGAWKLLSFEVIFERDTMTAVDPAQPLPIDRAKLATYRPAYRFLTAVQEHRGTRVNPDLFGDDRPEALQAFYDGEEAWRLGA